MKGFLKRLRGVIKTGLTWAIAWGGLFGAIILGFILWGAVFGPDDALEGLELFPRSKMVYGEQGKLVSSEGVRLGAVFSVLERHKNLKEITFKRVTLWGVLGWSWQSVALFYANIWNTHRCDPTLCGPGYRLSYRYLVALAKRADRKLIEGDGDSEESLEAS